MIPEIILLFLTMHKTVADSASDEMRCLYGDVSPKFGRCVEDNSNGLFLGGVMDNLLETDFTGEDLLSTLSSTCRNEQVLNAYSNCTSRAIADCPHVASVLTKEVKENLSVFCKNGAVTSWLNTVLQDGYIHKRKCSELTMENEVFAMVMECDPGFGRDTTVLTVESAISLLQRFFRQLFRCLVAKGPSFPDQDGDGVLDCGSSWQDVVLSYALRVSAIEELGFKIGEEEISELQAIRTD